MILVVVGQSVTMDTTQNSNSMIQVSLVLTYEKTIPLRNFSNILS